MYDIIGDIHGHHEALRALLYRLGYRFRGGAWRFPGARRRALFVGDFIDRGPQIPETLALVRGMLEADSALAVMGNHEYNALTWHTPDGNGGWLRRHTVTHRKQHDATLEQYGIDSAAPEGDRGVLDIPSPRGRGARRLREDLQWLRALPLYLETDSVRVVHAAWTDEAAAEAQNSRTSPRAGSHAPTPLVDDAFLHRSAFGQYRESRAVETLLKGIEIALPEGAWYLDKEGSRRHKTRIRWWLDPAAPVRTMADIAMPPADRELGHLPVSPRQREKLPGYTGSLPVFVGHYWFTGTPAPVAPRVACLDYSVARGGILCAYRFEGDPVLSGEHFVSVDASGGPTGRPHRFA
ncbi:MAG: metallophosphoesterase [Spirochaetaceae bacterium]|nr:MAG: metallophosphoesterase [Spirochaetaceae bacterium]